MDLLNLFNSIPSEELEPITPTTEPSWYQKAHAYDMRHGLKCQTFPCQFTRTDGYVERYEELNGCLINSDYVTEEDRKKDEVYRKTAVKSRGKRQRHRS